MIVSEENGGVRREEEPERLTGVGRVQYSGFCPLDVRRVLRVVNVSESDLDSGQGRTGKCGVHHLRWQYRQHRSVYRDGDTNQTSHLGIMHVSAVRD